MTKSVNKCFEMTKRIIIPIKSNNENELYYIIIYYFFGIPIWKHTTIVTKGDFLSHFADRTICI